MECTKCQFLVTDSENKTCGIKIQNAHEYYGIDKDVTYRCEGLEVRSYSARCFLCENGYALSYEGKCKKVYKKNCLLQTQILKEIPIFDKNNKKVEGEYRRVELEVCLVCDRYFPKIVLDSEFRSETEKDYGDCIEKLSQSEFPHCKYGAVEEVEENIIKEGKVIGKKKVIKKKCSGCDKDNYAVDVSSGQCDLFPRDMLGCMRMKDGKCIMCNHYRGYYMTSPGSCKKFSVFVGIRWVFVLIILGFL